MTTDQINDIDKAYKTFAFKNERDMQLQIRPDLDNAMRQLGHMPGEIELNEIRNQLDKKKADELREVKAKNKKQ
mgnify:CR=1 FL=1